MTRAKRRYGCTLGVPWTEEEKEALRASYARGGIKAAREALPNRSVHSIYRRARRLKSNRRPRWTGVDDERLRSMWMAADSLAEIATALGRSEATTFWRAQQLKLPIGCPPGWEYLTYAAERTGFASAQLRRIMKLEGFEVRRSLSRPSKRRGKRRGRRSTFQIVWPADVNAAVEAYLGKETLESAAKRAGVASETLRRRLKVLGLQQPTGKRRWYVTDEDVRRALSLKLVRIPFKVGRGQRVEYVDPKRAA